jgi:hypothetical protein
MNNIKKSQDEIKEGKNLALCDNNTIKYIQKSPIGKAIYKTKVGRRTKSEEEKAKPTDRIKCHICGTEFVRWNRSQHMKTKVCQAYSKMNTKIQKLMIE